MFKALHDAYVRGRLVKGMKVIYANGAGGSFDAYLHARKNRQDDFFIRPAGGADLCNVNVPVRAVPSG